jgi:hypothetical protein
LRLKRIVATDAASSTKYHARGSPNGASITTPVENPRRVSYS